MERVETMGCDVFRTDEDGAILLRAVNGKISVERFNDRNTE